MASTRLTAASPVSVPTAEITHHPIVYRNDIDGLRGLAVWLVMLCHAGLSQFSGGFIGVDIFFVISGFVVSRTIINDIEQGGFSFAAFYARRAKRLAPALYLVAFSTFILGVVFCLPDKAMDIARNVGFLAIFWSNVFLSHKTGYFAPQASEMPLLHTWSLSVEEQFYLVLPLLLFVLLRRGRAVTVWVLAGLSVVSLAASQMALWRMSSGAYYLFPYRAYEFLLGVLAAIFTLRRAWFHSWWAEAGVLLGLLVILACAVGFDGSTPFPGWVALIPCAATVVLIVNGPRSRWVLQLLSNAPAAFMGKLSYCLYLWHWPVFFALRRFNVSGSASVWAGLAICLLLSLLTHFYLEKPLRYRAMSNRRAILTFVLGPILLAGALVVVGKRSEFMFLYPAQLKTVYHTVTKDVWNENETRTDACWEQRGISPQDKCRVGDLGSKRQGVLWGDSHAYHMLNFAEAIGHDYGLSLHHVAYPKCPPVGRMPVQPATDLVKSNRACSEHNLAVLDYLRTHPEIHTVVMGGWWSVYLSASGQSQASEYGFKPGAFEQALEQTVSTLMAQGKQVVLLDDVPVIPTRLINCQIDQLTWFAPKQSNCGFSISQVLDHQVDVRTMLEQIKVRHPGVSIIHTHDAACVDGQCSLAVSGAPLYRFNDNAHLSAAGSQNWYRMYRSRHPDELDAIFGPRVRF